MGSKSLKKYHLNCDKDLSGPESPSRSWLPKYIPHKVNNVKDRILMKIINKIKNLYVLHFYSTLALPVKKGKLKGQTKNVKKNFSNWMPVQRNARAYE
jgi:hypothetical protein